MLSSDVTIGTTPVLTVRGLRGRTVQALDLDVMPGEIVGLAGITGSGREHVLGLIAGAIAKAIMPGNDPGGFIVTMLIGIVGAFLGGFIGSTIAGEGLEGFSIQSIVLAVVGSILLLWIYRMATRGRSSTTRVP